MITRKEDLNLSKLQTHEFSPTWIKFLCRQSKDYLSQIHGPSFFKQLKESVLDQLGRNTTEDLDRQTWRTWLSWREGSNQAPGKQKRSP